MVPSGDDGVKTIDDAVLLCTAAATRGTALLYATPHVNGELPLTQARDRLVRANAARLLDLVRAEGLDIRVGYEVHPTVVLRGDDLGRYRLGGYQAILLECPLEPGAEFGADLVIAAAERIESKGLLPVLAHPERSPGFLKEQVAAADAARRGWLLQVTAASLLGQHGDDITRFTWSLLDRGHARLVASDAHRPDRPPFLDEALELLSRRLGLRRGVGLLDASALALAAVSEPAPAP